MEDVERIDGVTTTLTTDLKEVNENVEGVKVNLKTNDEGLAKVTTQYVTWPYH